MNISPSLAMITASSTRSPGALEHFFHPRSVALIGASEQAGSVGRGLLENLLEFPGEFFAVNPRHDFLLDRRSHPSLAAIQREIDLAIIAVPAAQVSGVVHECVEAGVHAAIVISAGFRESGAKGRELEAAVQEEARRGKMRIIGPNCLGLSRPAAGLNASFGRASPVQGGIAFLSQSGAVCAALLDWGAREKIGFSAFVSVGSMLDVGWGELIRYFGRDPETKAILLYMESVGDAASFLAAAREVAPQKPIIVLKAGRTEAAARAAASHTGAVIGRDDVFDAALRRVGVLRVDTEEELFGLAEFLDRAPSPAGPRLTIVTNAGGPGALAADAAVLAGGEVPPLSPETLASLDRLLPPQWSHGNPIDLLGDAPAARFGQALELVANDPASDGILVIPTPQSMTNPTASAKEVARVARTSGKPILASWIGGETVAEGQSLLRLAGIPTYPFPEAASRAFCQWAGFSKLREAARMAPASDRNSISGTSAREDVHHLAAARKRGHLILSEHESKELLARHGLPCVDTRLARSVDEAVLTAAAVSYPVALKLHSETVTHKSDCGGVELNIPDEAGVREAWDGIRSRTTAHAGLAAFLGVTVQPMIRGYDHELILGSASDPQFGPVIVFGSGGKWVELFRDTALGLPPLDERHAREIIDATVAGKILRGQRGNAAADLDELNQLIRKFSQLVIDEPAIKEVDLNPVVWTGTRFLILDARILLHPGSHESILPPALLAAPGPLTLAAMAPPHPGRTGDPAAVVAAPPHDHRPEVAASGALQRRRSRSPERA